MKARGTLVACRLTLADLVATPALLPAAEAGLALPGPDPVPASAGSTAALDGQRLAMVLATAAHGALAAVRDCRHCFRQPRNITALLDAILLPQLFQCETNETAYRCGGWQWK